MALLQSYRNLLIISLVITGSFDIVIPAPTEHAPRPSENYEPPVDHHVDKRQASNTNTIDLCIDCDGPCQSLIAGTTYKTATNYFNSLKDQLTSIFTASNMPIVVNLKLLTLTSNDIVLDPYGNFSATQSGMDYYWKGARIAARVASGCDVSFLVTDDPLFAKTTASPGLSYLNTMCDATWSYGISRLTNNFKVVTSRIGHELGHTMNINHVQDGQISFPNDVWVKINCSPDQCSDPTGMCITVSTMPLNPPFTFSMCGRAIWFAWKNNGYGSCIGLPVTYYDPGSG